MSELDVTFPNASILRKLRLPDASSVDAFELHDRDDLCRLRQRFKKNGRIQIRDILSSDGAKLLSTTIRDHHKWNLVTNINGRHMDLDAAGMAKLSTDDLIRFRHEVHAQARENFQYLFSNYPLYDAYHKGSLDNRVLQNLFAFINSKPMLTLVRHICADSSISFADAQLTRYEAGHFLTEHDDDVAGKNRRCAFVLNMTPYWRPDWGGLLQFFGKNNNIEEAFTPCFNALNIFRVPQKHSVSSVAPFANAPRLSVTGWFRAGDDPMASPRSVTHLP